jgi:hypothetical protein
VQWSPAGASEWQPVAGRQAVQAVDRVRTGPGAAARLVYPDGSATELWAQTGLLVQRLERREDGTLNAKLVQTERATFSRVVPLAEVASAPQPESSPLARGVPLIEVARGDPLVEVAHRYREPTRGANRPRRGQGGGEVNQARVFAGSGRGSEVCPPAWIA